MQAIDISNFEQKKTGEYVIDEGTSMIVAEPEVKYGSPRPVSIELEQTKRLSEIIDEINLEKGMHIDSNLAYTSLGQIKDILINNNDLKTSANINPFSNFGFSYYKNVDKALIEGYEHNKELYKLLLDDDDVKKRILGVYMEDIYNELKK